MDHNLAEGRWIIGSAVELPPGKQSHQYRHCQSDAQYFSHDRLPPALLSFDAVSRPTVPPRGEMAHQ
jgi:hypothetical protein